LNTDKNNNIKVKIQRFGSFLSGMVMPNIGAFIAWGLITALFIPTGWIPNAGAYNLDDTNLISRGKFNLEPLGLSRDAYTFEINVPGHFITKKIQKFGFEYKGVLYGKSESTNINIVGGDVNQDNVIDVQDALYIQTYWGTNKRSADINFDGTVDAKDFAFVEKNYLQQNPTVQNAPTPEKIYKNQTLETIKSELGL